MEKKLYRKLYCPIPEQQRPLKEYLNLKNSLFFDWSNFSLNILKFNFLSLIIFFILLTISNYFYYFFEFPIKLIYYFYCIILLIELILFFKIYLDWLYIEQRLNKPFIKYEESSWYDFEIWIKSIKIMKQDRLISYYKVSPILKKLRKIIVYYLLIYFLILIFNIFI
jgi:Conserved in the green lineage and diatoms 27